MNNNTTKIHFQEAAFLLSEGLPCTLLLKKDGRTDFIFTASELLETERKAFTENAVLQSYVEGVFQLKQRIWNLRKAQKGKSITGQPEPTNKEDSETEIVTENDSHA